MRPTISEVAFLPSGWQVSFDIFARSVNFMMLKFMKPVSKNPGNMVFADSLVNLYETRKTIFWQWFPHFFFLFIFLTRRHMSFPERRKGKKASLNRCGYATITSPLPPHLGIWATSPSYFSSQEYSRLEFTLGNQPCGIQLP